MDGDNYKIQDEPDFSHTIRVRGTYMDEYTILSVNELSHTQRNSNYIAVEHIPIQNDESKDISL